MFLPCEDNFLRNETLRRADREARITEEIEQGLLDVLNRELDMIRIQDENRIIMEDEEDYSIAMAYEAVDRCRAGNINVDNLGNFLSKGRPRPTDIELMAIIRRIDKDGDARLCFEEWAEFMRGGPAPICK
jgi:Ca2+-binding EF-hand superfamily protein